MEQQIKKELVSLLMDEIINETINTLHFGNKDYTKSLLKLLKDLKNFINNYDLEY